MCGVLILRLWFWVAVQGMPSGLIAGFARVLVECWWLAAGRGVR